MDFTLDPRLAADTVFLGDLPLSRALMMNDARFEWIILVPRRAGLVEIIDLDANERAQLMEEIATAARALQLSAGVEKINVGALGNIVRQLHVHVVGRREGDAAWPGPVWGFGAAQRYDDATAAGRVEALRKALGLAA